MSAPSCSVLACGTSRRQRRHPSGAAHHLRARPEVLFGGAIEAEYASDTSNAFILGIDARRGRNLARFAPISQNCLRDDVKQWFRFRLGAGYSFSTIDAGCQSLRRFSVFLDEHPEVRGHRDISRELLEAFLV